MVERRQISTGRRAGRDGLAFATGAFGGATVAAVASLALLSPELRENPVLHERIAAQEHRLQQFELADRVGVAPAVGTRFKKFVEDHCLEPQVFPSYHFPGVHRLVLEMDKPLVRDFKNFLKANGGGEHELAIRASELAFGMQRILKPGEKQISLKELTNQLSWSLHETELPVAFPETYSPHMLKSPEYKDFEDDTKAGHQLYTALLSYPGLAKRLVQHFTHGQVTVK